MPVFDDAFFKNRLVVCKKELIQAHANARLAAKAVYYWTKEYDMCLARLGGQLSLFAEGGDLCVKA